MPALAPTCSHHVEAERSCWRRLRAACEKSGFHFSRSARFHAGISGDRPHFRYRRPRFLGGRGESKDGSIVTPTEISQPSLSRLSDFVLRGLWDFAAKRLYKTAQGFSPG